MNNLKTKAKSRQKGFTLIELTITLTLITLLASALIYSWRAMKEKASVAHGVQGAGCLQTALVGLEALAPAEQDAMTHKLSGTSLVDFNAAAEGLGCKLGPTPGSPTAKQVIFPDDCIVWICRRFLDRVVPHRFESCSTFSSSSLGWDEMVCNRVFSLPIPDAPTYRIHMSAEDPIRVERVSAPPAP